MKVSQISIENNSLKPQAKALGLKKTSAKSDIAFGTKFSGSTFFINHHVLDLVERGKVHNAVDYLRGLEKLAKDGKDKDSIGIYFSADFTNAHKHWKLALFHSIDGHEEKKLLNASGSAYSSNTLTVASEELCEKIVKIAESAPAVTKSEIPEELNKKNACEFLNRFIQELIRR